ncbi:MAG: type III pantothenate kinase [Oscillospiraceae bacterium]
MIAAANIGNTNTAVGLWDEGWQWTVRVPTAAIESAEGFLAQLARRSGEAAPLAGADDAVVASVVPAKTLAVAQALAARTGKPPKCFQKGGDVPLNLSTYDGTLLGADRAVCCYSALQLFPPPLLVFDVGTALSVSAVDAYGRFAGGAILPGMVIGLQALASGTALLPMVTPDDEVPLLGKNTAQCLAAGSLYGMCGAIDGYARRLEQEWAHPITCILTGGDAALVAPHLVCSHYLRPTLLLDGLVALCRLRTGQPH